MNKAKRIKTLEGYSRSLEERIEELESDVKNAKTWAVLPRYAKFEARMEAIEAWIRANGERIEGPEAWTRLASLAKMEARINKLEVAHKMEAPDLETHDYSPTCRCRLCMEHQEDLRKHRRAAERGIKLGIRDPKEASKTPEPGDLISYDPMNSTSKSQKALWVDLLSHVYNVHNFNMKECALCEDIRVAFGEAGKLIQTEFKKCGK